VRSAFARWGFSFGDLTPALLSLEEEQELTTYTQVDVYSIPDMIADKLLSETELQDLTKNFLAQLEADGTEHWPRHGPMAPPDVVELNPVDETALNADTNWTLALRWCPRDILDLINSKSCRGAVMFNDPLDIEQCKRLVWQLSQIILPFQCAHGRPSLIPITSVLGGPNEPERCHTLNWTRFCTS